MLYKYQKTILTGSAEAALCLIFKTTFEPEMIKMLFCTADNSN